MYTRLLKHRQIKDFHWSLALKIQQTTPYPKPSAAPCLVRWNERGTETCNSCTYCSYSNSKQINYILHLFHYFIIAHIDRKKILKKKNERERESKTRIQYLNFQILKKN